MAGERIKFQSRPITVDVGQLSTDIVIQRVGGGGRPSRPNRPLTVNLSSDSTKHEFQDLNGATIRSVDILAGESNASFRYVDYVEGNPMITITCDLAGLEHKDQQRETIRPPGPVPAAVQDKSMVRVRFIDQHGMPVAGNFDAKAWFYRADGRRQVDAEAVKGYANWYVIEYVAELLCLKPETANLWLGCGFSLETDRLQFRPEEGGYCCLDYPTRTCELSGFSFEAKKTRISPSSGQSEQIFAEGMAIRAKYVAGGCVHPSDSEVRIDCCGNASILAEAGLWRLTAEPEAGYEFDETGDYCGKDRYIQVCSGQVLRVKYHLKKVATSVCIVLNDEKAQLLDGYMVILCGRAADESRRPVDAKAMSQLGIVKLDRVAPGENSITILDNNGQQMLASPSSLVVQPSGTSLVVAARRPQKPGIVEAYFPTASGKALVGAIEFVQLAADGSVQQVLQTVKPGPDGGVRLQAPDAGQPLASFLMNKAFRVRGVVYPCANYLQEPAASGAVATLPVGMAG